MESEENPNSDFEEKGVIRKGDSFFRTSNTDLAVALLTLGVRPFKSHPIVKSYEKGEQKTFFHLETKSPDGEIQCMECLKYWKQGTAFIDENPEHPFSIAMATLLNRKSFMGTVKRKKAICTYKLGSEGPTVFVTEGTKRQIALEHKYGNQNKK